ncbi:MAG: hypothetical protein Q7S74_00045 [Nanoarchaeota archaeon]|nr:hypothetical protein [Nanoarchaeota archaeon]
MNNRELMSAELELGSRDFIPFLGEKSYRKRKESLTDRMNLNQLKRYEMNHTLLTIYNSSLIVLATYGIIKGIDSFFY